MRFLRLFCMLMSFYIPLQNSHAASNKIMIFWYGMGMGHRVPSERIKTYIEQEFKSHNQSVQVDLVDIKRFSLFDPSTEETGKQKYLDWASRSSYSYTKYFQWYLETHPKDLKSNFDLYRLAHYLKKKKPDLIISTFWGAGHSFYQIKRILGSDFNVPHAMLYTDYKIRKFAFMAPEIDKIFLGSKSLKDAVTAKYPALAEHEDHFDYSGIPVNYEKIKGLLKEDKNTVKTRLGFNPNKTLITLARGGEVQLPLTELIKKIIAGDPEQKTEILVLAGRSESDHAELTALIKKYGSHRLKKLGFIANPTYLEHIRASDLLVTKPGGVGITEASLLEIPLILMKGLGGQEKDNSNEFVEHGLAYFAPNKEMICAKIKDFLEGREDQDEILQKNHDYFKNYQPKRIAKWAYQNIADYNWTPFENRLSHSSIIPRLQNLTDLSPIALKKWYDYLIDTGLSDLSKEEKLKKSYIAKARLAINHGINLTKEEIEQYTEDMEVFRDSERSHIETKWKLFRTIIIDQILHIGVNASYVSPKRELLEELTTSLLEFIGTSEFKGHKKVWEFTEESIYRALAYFYYLGKDYDRAIIYVDKAINKSPSDYYNENLIQIKANILKKRKRYRDAIIFQKAYLKRSPNMHEIRLSLADHYSDQNFKSEAYEQVRQLLQRKKNMTEKDYFRAASIYLKFSEPKRAIALLQKALEKKKESLFLHALYIRLLASHKDQMSGADAMIQKLKPFYLQLEAEYLRDLSKFPLRAL